MHAMQAHFDAPICACVFVIHTYARQKTQTRSSKGRISKGYWKATIDRSWGMKVNGGTPPPPPRPAALVMAEKARLLAEQEKGTAADSAAAAAAASDDDGGLSSFGAAEVRRVLVGAWCDGWLRVLLLCMVLGFLGSFGGGRSSSRECECVLLGEWAAMGDPIRINVLRSPESNVGS